MSYGRTRQRVSSVLSRGQYWNPMTKVMVAKNSNSSVHQTCTDTVGNRKGVNAFYSETLTTSDISISGVKPYSATDSWRFERAYTWAGINAPPAHLLTTAFAMGELDQLGMDLIAKSNPNAAHVSIPTFVGELKDLPGLVRSFGVEHLRKIRQYQSGLDFSRELADRHLQLRWGILPMVSDVKKMLGFIEQVERRVRWYMHLNQGKALRRRVGLGQKTASGSAGNIVIWSEAGGFLVYSGQRTTITRQSTWGSAQWTLQGSARPPWRNTDDIRKSAVRAVYGLNPGSLGLTAWELLPWSWMADWFLNLQSLLGAMENAIPVTHSKLCIMRRTVSFQTSAGPYSTDARIKPSGSWGHCRDTKTRTPIANPMPVTVSFQPLIEADKWLILGSLAIQRRP